MAFSGDSSASDSEGSGADVGVNQAASKTAGKVPPGRAVPSNRSQQEASRSPSSISNALLFCLKGLQGLTGRLKDPYGTYGSPQLSAPWEDELGRLRVWAANIGAHRVDQASLDYRLRDASHIKSQIQKLLRDLRHAIRDTEDLLRELESPPSSPGHDETSNDGEDETEMEQMHGDVASIVTCLFQMSMLVRRPAQHDLWTQKTVSEISVYEPYDYEHVRNKFPNAPEVLVKRLSLAMTVRRKILRSRELRHVKLGKGLTEDADEDVVTCGSPTVATSFKAAEELEQRTTRSEWTQTSYASTFWNGGSESVPGPPKQSDGGTPFECPYCFYIIVVKDRRAWYKHLFSDLQPYLCLSVSCATPHRLYGVQHEWLDHMKTAHTNRPHLMPGSISSIVPAVSNADDASLCPLCTESVANERLLGRHLSHHMQELACFVLPHTGFESDETESEDIPPLNPDSSPKAYTSFDAGSEFDYQRPPLPGIEKSPYPFNASPTPATIAWGDKSLSSILSPTTATANDQSYASDWSSRDSRFPLSGSLSTMEENSGQQTNQTFSVTPDGAPIQSPFDPRTRWRCSQPSCHMSQTYFPSQEVLDEHKRMYHSPAQLIEVLIKCPYIGCEYCCEDDAGLGLHVSTVHHPAPRHSDDSRVNSSSTVLAKGAQEYGDAGGDYRLIHSLASQDKIQSPASSRSHSPWPELDLESPPTARRDAGQTKVTPMNDKPPDLTSGQLEVPADIRKPETYPPVFSRPVDPITGTFDERLEHFRQSYPQQPSQQQMQQTQHERSPIKRHKCPYCNTEFTRAHNLKSHLLTHSQEKPYSCQTCYVRFRRLHDLKRHTKLHTGEPSHACATCDRKFARVDALARHRKDGICGQSVKASTDDNQFEFLGTQSEEQMPNSAAHGEEGIARPVNLHYEEDHSEPEAHGKRRAFLRGPDSDSDPQEKVRFSRIDSGPPSTTLEDPDDIVEAKRIRNTMAARKSRQKRLEQTERLQDSITELQDEVDYWKNVAAARKFT